MRHEDGPRLAPLLGQGQRGQSPSVGRRVQPLNGVGGGSLTADDVDVTADRAHLGPATSWFGQRWHFEPCPAFK